ncbi:MAG TPA: S9 family peptidase [Blastocatellia bacterium]|nr:S9 family peptidase [Blastocatellia bacterium]
MKRAILLVTVFLLSLTITALSQQSGSKRPMTFEDILELKNVSDAQISPDGKWVAYVVTSVDMKEDTTDADIWLVSTSGGEPIRLTTNKKNDNQPRWSPDGKRIAFISAREDKPQIFLISPTGGEAEKLTDAKSGVQSFQWSPDGQTIAYVGLQDLTPEQEKKQKEKDDAEVVDKNFRFAHLWTIDVHTKKTKEIVKNDYVVSDPQWSPDGHSIAYVATMTPKADDGGKSDIWILDVDSGKQRKLFENDGPDNAPRWSPDGKQIAFLSRDAKNGNLGQSEMVVVPAEGGTPVVIVNASSIQPSPAVWATDGKDVYFNASDRTTSQLFRYPAVPKKNAIAKLSDRNSSMGQATFSKDRSIAAFTRSDIQHPGDIYIAKLNGNFEPVKLTNHNPQVDGLALGKSEIVRWKSKDGMEIEGIVIYPVDYQPGKKYPTVAFIHGGPAGAWTQAFPGSWGYNAHVWAGRGWVSFYPNVRGSSGYGEKFLLSNVHDWGGGDFQDIQTGLDYLIAKGISDPNKLAQSGWSYGGYMTAWTLTQTNRFQAVAVGAGLTDMYSMYSTNDLQSTLDGYFGGEPWNNEEAYRKASAMTFIKQAKTPTLILHGAADTRVPPDQSKELYMGLKKNKVPVELVFFPREPHGLQEPRHQLDKMRREYAWFSKYVLDIEVPEIKASDSK